MSSKVSPSPKLSSGMIHGRVAGSFEGYGCGGGALIGAMIYGVTLRDVKGDEGSLASFSTTYMYMC